MSPCFDSSGCVSLYFPSSLALSWILCLPNYKLCNDFFCMHITWGGREVDVYINSDER